ncbi:5-oxoprolinase subunit PxpA [Gallaecimonas sp. GXIMD1310]|uniref:5-oxoprolinase subunit PxpA n=1 Tax=Gallaecimonas sp. GXIMD1310 TaxID=3131926 RepID=UPI00324CC046
MHIDFNADLGEGYDFDSELMPLLSSVNIACGFHAGNPTLMAATLDAALEHGVAIGAHPGYDDKSHFGRRPQQLPLQQVYDLVLYQAGALKAMAEARGGRLHHIKPHGALYNQAAEDPALAEAIVCATKALGDNVMLYGLAGSALIECAQAVGVPAVSEVFADRRYRADGSLTPRSEPDAVLADHQQVRQQVMDMVCHGRVYDRDGNVLSLRAETLCLHGDNPAALALAQMLSQSLTDSSITIRVPDGKR